MKKPVYLDNHATTPCDPRVVQKMLPFFSDSFGNASSSHRSGKAAKEEVELARARVADLIGASPSEIVFTSGATESINMSIFGIAKAYKEKGDHLVTVATEHRAVLHAHQELEKEGFGVTYLQVEKDGKISANAVRDAIRDKTILVSVMAANNEIGTIQPIQEIGRIVKEKGVFFHCDAVQAVGKMEVDVDKFGIDLLPMSAHKIYGPKGVGALYIRKTNPRIRFTPMIYGGGQEKGLRSGTLNVPGIVGFGEAAQISKNELTQEVREVGGLRNLLRDQIMSRLDGVNLNGHRIDRTPNNLSLSFDGVDGQQLFLAIGDDLCVSAGATCTSTTIQPSHVLTAIGLTPELANGTIRFGLGRFNSEEDVRFAADTVVRVVTKLRQKN